VLRAQEIASNSKVPQKQAVRLALPTLFEILVTATVVVETFDQLEQISESDHEHLDARKPDSQLLLVASEAYVEGLAGAVAGNLSNVALHFSTPCSLASGL
jgi:hypothetical protein